MLQMQQTGLLLNLQYLFHELIKLPQCGGL